MKSALVIGGGSHLGKRIVQKFSKSSPIWKVYNIDYRINPEAYENFDFKSDFNKINIPELSKKVDNKYDVIINASSSYSKCELNNNDIIQLLQKANDLDLNSSLLAAYLAQNFLKEKGLFVLMGSDNRTKNTHSNFIVDNITKESVSYLTELLIKNPSELPLNAKLITLLV
jgi:hypothetical protein